MWVLWIFVVGIGELFVRDAHGVMCAVGMRVITVSMIINPLCPQIAASKAKEHGGGCVYVCV